MKATVSTLLARDGITIGLLEDTPSNRPRPEAFDIIWLKGRPPPEQFTHRPPDCLGDCLYLLPPGKEYPLRWFGQAGALIRFHPDVLHYEATEFSIEVNQLFTQQENFSVLFVEPPLTRTLDQVYQLLAEEYAGDCNFLLLRTLLKVLLLKLIDCQSHRFIK